MSGGSMTLDDFEKRLEGVTKSELVAMVAAELGVTLTARSRKDAVQEAYELYCKREAGEELPAPASASSEPPAPAEPAPAEPAPAEPAPARVEYEGRSRTGRAFRRCGRTLVPAWRPIGALNEDELAEFHKQRANCQIRPVEVQG